jgi:hypothetical protein
MVRRAVWDVYIDALAGENLSAPPICLPRGTLWRRTRLV